MNPTCFRALGALLLAGIVACAAVAPGPLFAAAQAGGGEASIQERLSRLRNELFSRADRINETMVELKEILAVDPRSAEGHFLLGIAYGRLGSAELVGEAKAELRQALALNPGLVEARYYLGEVYLQLGRAERAREELEAALTELPRHPQVLALLGEAERQLGDPRRSLEVNRQALQIDQSFVQARYYVGLALLDLGQRDEAIEELERVVRSGSRVPDVYLRLGGAYLEAGRLEEALDVLRKGAEIDPSRPDMRIQLARAYRSNGLLDEAEAQLELTLPEGAPVLASAYYQQIESDLYLEQGLVKLQQRQLDGARKAFTKALDIDPDHGPAHRHLAEVYLLQDLATLASEHAARAAKLGFPLPEDKRKSLQEKLHGKETRRRE